MMKKTLINSVEKILLAAITFAVQAWLLKLLWNGLGPAQGLAPVSWLAAMGWMIACRTLLGTGDIASTLKRGANK
jgi:hypothetical protein